jgi:hypothetical protein
LLILIFTDKSTTPKATKRAEMQSTSPRLNKRTDSIEGKLLQKYLKTLPQA